jgi:pimeloyl-ACP methyl ester carboxylesterase
MAQGKVASALITAMKETQRGPPIFTFMPRWLLEHLTNMVMKSEDKKAKGHDATVRMLAPTLHYDFQRVVEMRETLESLRAIQVAVLLLGGRKSPAYLKAALDALEKLLPHVRRIEFPDSVMAPQVIPIEAASRNEWRKNCADFLPNRRVRESPVYPVP